MSLGADYRGRGRCEFTVWAPLLEAVALHLVSPVERSVPMERTEEGYWHVLIEDIAPGARYVFTLDNKRDRPDPASHYQPAGVHGPSAVVDHDGFDWRDRGWRGIPLRDMIIYEVHTGTFTPEGTFDAAVGRLQALADLGVNAIELMPVSQFPGDRNWGYDGVYPFAVQDSYGGPDGLKRLVDACHAIGIAVLLDVVYNHLGPEGNYIWDFGPYFTDKYRTPWGWAINYDDSYSNDVRRYFIENALYWFENYHIDGLRLDAIHGITDMSARPFLLELAERVEAHSETKRKKCYLIAESDLNDSRVIRPRDGGGDGLDATWCDDFHHALHVLLTDERDGYYIDFGGAGDLVKSLREGFVYSGGYSAFRKRNHGNASLDRPADQFVVFSQNHDQVGNRMLGERLAGLVSFESLKLAAGAVLLSPYVPLLFMGEEYGEDAPFLYFVSHSDPGLVEAVRTGRRAEFSAFCWQGDLPDPQQPATFLKSKLSWNKRSEGAHAALLAFYRRLIRLRRELPALRYPDREGLDVWGSESERTMVMTRGRGDDRLLCIFNFGESPMLIKDAPEGPWRLLLDSSAAEWRGPGGAVPDRMPSDSHGPVKPRSLVLYAAESAG